MIATVERVERGWLVMVDGKPHTLHDELSCDYAWSNAQSEADRINGNNVRAACGGESSAIIHNGEMA